MSRKQQQDNRPPPPPVVEHGRTMLVLAFFSGFGGLVYQILWMKQLDLLFGNTAHATAVTLGAFFGGLAVGSWFWGRRIASRKNPLALYAFLEGGIALTALLYFVILGIASLLYPLAFRSVSSAPLMLAVKFLLSLLLVFPPSFCMGGTIPVLGQTLVRERSQFGRLSALLYGVNTLGAAAGVACAAFLLVPTLGFNLTCILSILISSAIGGVAWRLSRQANESVAQTFPIDAGVPDSAHTPAQGRTAIAIICFFSGFGILALEVIWTRLFALVHTNSVYAFSVILVVVLTCLAIGSGISARLARLKYAPLPTLGILTLLGGITLAFGPALFMVATDQMSAHSAMEPWAVYMSRLFVMGFIGIGLVALVLGTIFPFLMKAAEQQLSAPGQTLGRLMAINTTGAIAGSLVCGFVLIPMLGMWRSMQLITALYLVTALLLPLGRGRTGLACRGASLIFLALIFTVLDPSERPRSAQDAARDNEVILQTWEGRDGTVTVAENASGSRFIKVNSSYALGSTGAYREQVNQAWVPLYLFPETRSIFFLGLGTGISAGAALHPQFPHVERIVSCELIPEVVEAAREYMPEEMTGGLFTDPRSTILIEDGRHYLMATDDTFDMINADLFLPYRRGAGSLYSLDHYRTARKRLTPGGVYVQWLPLFQLTEKEFHIITRTMLEAFEHLTMWRNNFEPGKEIVALIGQTHPTPLAAVGPDAEALPFETIGPAHAHHMRPGLALPLHAKTAPFLYCGNVSAARELFARYPVNTDNRPLVEYLAPRLFRQFSDDPIIWCVGPKIAVITDRMLDRCPPERDPFLAKRTLSNRQLVHAGTAFHRSQIWGVLGEEDTRLKEWRTFIREWNASVQAGQR